PVVQLVQSTPPRLQLRGSRRYHGAASPATRQVLSFDAKGVENDFVQIAADEDADATARGNAVIRKIGEHLSADREPQHVVANGDHQRIRLAAEVDRLRKSPGQDVDPTRPVAPADAHVAVISTYADHIPASLIA